MIALWNIWSWRPRRRRCLSIYLYRRASGQAKATRDRENEFHSVAFKSNLTTLACRNHSYDPAPFTEFGTIGLQYLDRNLHFTLCIGKLPTTFISGHGTGIRSGHGTGIRGASS
jgi:hypothetical protein